MKKFKVIIKDYTGFKSIIMDVPDYTPLTHFFNIIEIKLNSFGIYDISIENFISLEQYVEPLNH